MYWAQAAPIKISWKQAKDLSNGASSEVTKYDDSTAGMLQNI